MDALQPVFDWAITPYHLQLHDRQQGILIYQGLEAAPEFHFCNAHPHGYSGSGKHTPVANGLA